MPVTVNVNGLSLVHQGSTGIAMATTPDVCLTPSFGSPVPIPYPNIAMSTDLLLGSLMVKADGGMMVATQGSKFFKSTGDEPGVVGGVVSHLFIGEASFISFSPTVLMEGKPACRLTDKMLMNMGNTVCMGGVLQNPVPPAPELPLSKEPVFCVFKDLTLKCGNDKRSYKAVAARDVRIAVIAAPKDTVNFTYDATCGLTRTSPGCGRLEVKGPDGIVPMKGPTAVELQRPRSAGLFERSWVWLFKYIIFPRNVPTDIYTVKSYTCGGQGGCSTLMGEYGVIEVFPNVKWTGEVKMSYDPEREKAMVAGKERATLALDPKAPAEWEIAGKFEAEYGAGKLTFEPKTKYDVGTGKDTDPLTAKLFDGTQGLLNCFGGLFRSLLRGGVVGQIKILPLEFGFGGGIKLVEDEEGKDVVTEGSLWMGADTIVGAKIEADILDWIILIAGAGALGSFLVKVKKMGEKGGNFKNIAKGKLILKIALSLEIKLGGKVGWKGVKGKWEIDPEAAFIEAGGGAKLEGIAQGQVCIWKLISAGAGASIGMMGSDGKSPCGFTGKIAPDAPALKPSVFPVHGVLEFSGLAIYYALYAELGAGGAEAEKPAAGEPEAAAGPFGSWSLPVKRREATMDKLAELIAPHSWPSDKKSDLENAMSGSGGGGGR
jgi:hypothetical protein